MDDLIWIPFFSHYCPCQLPIPSPLNKRGRYLHEHQQATRWRVLPCNNQRGQDPQWVAEIALTKGDFVEYTLLYVDE